MGNAESSPEEVPVVECGDDVFREDADAGFAPTDYALDSAAGVAANLAALNLPLEAVGEASGGDKTFTAAAVERRMSDYKLESKVLGEGGFGKVKLATCTRTGHQVAVKIIKRNKLNERAEVLLKREVKHHERLRHPNIVRLYTWIKTPARYFLVMECCPEGDLLQYLNARRRLASAEVSPGIGRGPRPWPPRLICPRLPWPRLQRPCPPQPQPALTPAPPPGRRRATSSVTSCSGCASATAWASSTETSSWRTSCSPPTPPPRPPPPGGSGEWSRLQTLASPTSRPSASRRPTAARRCTRRPS